MAFASRAVCLLLVSLALCQVATVQATEKDDIVAAFTGITTMSGNLRDLTSSINLVNILFKGPQVAQGFGGIINAVTEAISMLNGVTNNPPLADADAQAVVNALKEFVMIHQELLSVVIGKHGLLSLFFLTQPIGQALRSLEQIVDSFAFLLIALIPTQAPAANGQFSDLGATLGQAITVYS